jgi:hypothetical protein
MCINLGKLLRFNYLTFAIWFLSKGYIDDYASKYKLDYSIFFRKTKRKAHYLLCYFLNREKKYEYGFI